MMAEGRQKHQNWPTEVIKVASSGKIFSSVAAGCSTTHVYLLVMVLSSACKTRATSQQKNFTFQSSMSIQITSTRKNLYGGGP
jgi:hypothetical protein